MARALISAPAAKASVQLNNRFDSGKYRPRAAPSMFEDVAARPNNATIAIAFKPIMILRQTASRRNGFPRYRCRRSMPSLQAKNLKAGGREFVPAGCRREHGSSNKFNVRIPARL